MDNAQKAIMIGVGLFITIVVIAAVMMILGVGQDMTDSGLAEIQGLSDQLTESLRSTYDQKEWSGRQTQEKLRALASEENLAVYVHSSTIAGLTKGSFDATGEDTSNGILRVGKALITGDITVNGTGRNTTSAFLADDKATVSGGGDSTSSGNLATIISGIKTSYKYKSVLISNTEGKTVGVLFVRYY